METNAFTTNSFTVCDVLRRGDRSYWVQVLQQELQNLGEDVGLVDGFFGPRTEIAVKNAQRTFGLLMDGVVGPDMWEKLGYRFEA